MSTFLGDFKKGIAGLVQTAAGSPLPVIHQFSDLFEIYNKTAADGAAATATADTLFFTNPYDFTLYVVSGKVTCTGAGITADPSNFATITIKTDAGTGGATAIALTVATTVADGGTFVISQPKAFTLVTAANVAVPPGGGLWLNIAKSGTGVVVPVSFFTVRLQRAE